ncbi:MAG TPA: PQQ-dependent sugar dehydrogenase [Burkholderiaceae bacterium]|nr:PQQ-dependent sugar dehydrogenase [Burkholderiaceae bacterium]
MQAPTLSTLLLPVPLVFAASLACAQTGEVRTGTAAFASWKVDAPGVRRLIKPSDLSAPPPVKSSDAEKSIASNATVVDPPQGALPKVPDGFAVQVFASGFKQPRTMRIAPNGDIFLSESGAGRVLVFRASEGGTPAKPEVFAENLERPYGIAFVPPADPQYVYVAAANQVVRYPYRNGELKAAGPAEVVIGNIPTRRHWTRDLAVSRDGTRLFLAVGSGTNLAGDMTTQMIPERIRQLEKTHGRGAAWGEEENRAVVRIFDPEGNGIRNYATGLRNCSGLAMQPGTDNLWCVVNERDHLGPNLVPDYMARVQDGAFYGWPW